MINKINFIKNAIGNFNMYIYVPAGSIYEKDGIRGISHLLEHMLMKHTKNYTNKELYKEITRIGGISNAGTSKDITYYFIKTHVDNYKITVKILYDIIHNPIFSNEEFDKEIKIVMEEFVQREDNVDVQLDEMATCAVLADKNPYLHPVRGSRKDLTHMTQAVVRKFFNQQYKDYMIVVNCDYRFLKEVKQYIFHVFGQNEKIDLVPRNQGDLASRSADILSEGRVLLRQNSLYAQYSTVLSFVTFPTSMVKEIVVMNFIKFILTSAGFNSILFEEIREQRGLVYGINSTHEDGRYLGLFKISFASTNPNIQYIVSLVLSCLHRLKIQGVSEKQLQYFRQSYINRFKYFFSDPSMRELWYGNCLFYKLELDEKRYIKMIKGMTNKDVIRVSKHVFNFKAMGIASIGPYKINGKNIERDLKQLKDTYDNL